MGRIGKLLQELGKDFWVAQGQTDGEVQPVTGRQAVNGLQAGDDRGRLAGEPLLCGWRRRLGRDGRVGLGAGRRQKTPPVAYT
jgi:hypothetical protein